MGFGKRNGFVELDVRDNFHAEDLGKDSVNPRHPERF